MSFQLVGSALGVPVIPPEETLVRVAPVSMAPVSRAPVRLAPVRLAPVRLAPGTPARVRSAPVRSAPVRSALVKLVPMSLALARWALPKWPLVKSHQLKFTLFPRALQSIGLYARARGTSPRHNPQSNAPNTPILTHRITRCMISTPFAKNKILPAAFYLTKNLYVYITIYCILYVNYFC